MLVDNKQSRNVLKNFEMIFFFFFFEICCSHPKIKFKDVKSMDPKMLAIILFHLFFERVFLNKESFFSILLFTKFLSFQQNSNKAEIKLYEQNTGAFG